jgi:hypothetical protein
MTCGCQAGLRELCRADPELFGGTNVGGRDDRQILSGYRLFPVHYLAYARWKDADSQLQVPKAAEVFPARSWQGPGRMAAPPGCLP